MADDTRVTHSRPGYACALALLCVLGLSLPAEALASDIVVRRDPGLTAAERADVRADAGVVLERMLPLANTELVSVPAAREDRALAILNADPDVRFAAPDVAVHAAADFVEQSLANANDGDVDGPEAWEYAEGLGVTVGVADMSIGDQHPDLLGNVEAARGLRRRGRLSDGRAAHRSCRPWHARRGADRGAARRHRHRGSRSARPCEAAAHARRLRRRQAVRRPGGVRLRRPCRDSDRVGLVRDRPAAARRGPPGGRRRLHHRVRGQPRNAVRGRRRQRGQRQRRVARLPVQQPGREPDLRRHDRHGGQAGLLGQRRRGVGRPVRARHAGVLDGARSHQPHCDSAARPWPRRWSPRPRRCWRAWTR